VGMVGIGLLGKSVATRLLDSGYKLTLYNRTKEKAMSLTNLGATVVENPKDVAKDCELVITILNDAKSVEEVAFGDNGIVKGNHDGLVIADMTTIDPVASKSIAKKFKEYGIIKLDIPVMGGPPLAVKGELLMMVGGEKDTYEKLKKVFDAIASQIFYIGENGTSNAIKLAMNLQIAMLALALSEGITLTKGAGLDPEIFLRILNSTYFKTGMSENKAYKMIKANYEPTFYLKLMKKDLDTINAAANQFNLRLPMAILANKLYQNATDSGFGELDYTGILSLLEKTSALKK
ncbi:MAG: NAD(P)-dependent oxidoreductase, partial [Nitrosopumilaceae archaeon]